MHHSLKPVTVAKVGGGVKRAAAAPTWPSYTGVSQLAGVSPSGRVTVYVDPSLGAPGAQNANDLLNDADRVVEANDALFGTSGGPVSVIVFALGGATDGTGGADHMGCDYVNGAAIEVCASFGQSERVSGLFAAVLSECSMGGNLCGESTGEALSRWCASVISGNALSDFATAPTWAQDGMPNYVDQTDPTDQNADSIGCGMAFLSWLMSQGYSLSAIAQEMVQLQDAGTLAQLYANLTSDSAANAWPHFHAAASALPQVTSDDPFGVLGRAATPAVEGGHVATAAKLGTLKITLSDNIAARDLQALLNIADEIYAEAAPFAQGDGSSEKADSTDGIVPEAAQELMISRLEIGTPNFLELIGNLDQLTNVATYLGAILAAGPSLLAGARAYETVAKGRIQWLKGTELKRRVEGGTLRAARSKYPEAHAAAAMAPQPRPETRQVSKAERSNRSERIAPAKRRSKPIEF
jgi:hypothetical protein